MKKLKNIAEKKAILWYNFNYLNIWKWENSHQLKCLYPILICLESGPTSACRSVPAMCPGSSRFGPTSLDPCHPHGRFQRSSWLSASSWPCSSATDVWGVNQEVEIISVSILSDPPWVLTNLSIWLILNKIWNLNQFLSKDMWNHFVFFFLP